MFSKPLFGYHRRVLLANLAEKRCTLGIEPFFDKTRTGNTAITPEKGRLCDSRCRQWHIGMGWRKPDGTCYETAPREKCDSKNLKRNDGFDVDYSQRIDGGPVDVGFDYFWGTAGSLDMPPFCFIENDHTVGIPDREKHPYSPQQKRGLMTEGWRDDQVDVVFAEKACEYIKLEAGKSAQHPFFLYLTPSAPHRPCVPPEFVKGSSQAGDRGDCVQLVDWLVGKVLNALTEKGISENTLLMISSDNGAVATCLNGLDYGHKSNGGLRGQKADIWEGGHREPFIAQWPGKIPPGSVCSDTVCLVDIMATCADITGTRIPDAAGRDSQSFCDSLMQNGNTNGGRKSLVHHSHAGMFGIRKGNWKLALGLGSGGITLPSYIFQEPDMPEGQLYNLTDDPEEQKNLYADYPDKVVELKAELLSTFEE